MRTLKDVMDKLEQHPEQGEIIFKEPLQLYMEMLKDPNHSPLAKVQLLQIPSIRSMSQELQCYDFKKLKELRSQFTKQLALACKPCLEQLLKDHAEPVSATPNEPASEEMQIRELRNACRNLLAKIDPKALDDVYNFYAGETNFNNSVAAFNILINSSSDKKEAVSEDFYNKWKDTPAVFNNWLIANAASATCTVADLKRLEKVEGFKPNNSNHLRSLYRVFCNNLGCYHDDKGEGYKFIVDKILEIASFNPMLANNYIAADAFIDFENLPAQQQALMASELQRLAVPQVPEQIRDFATRLLKKYTDIQ
jgi:aminopeptidase N